MWKECNERKKCIILFTVESHELHSSTNTINESNADESSERRIPVVKEKDFKSKKK